MILAIICIQNIYCFSDVPCTDCCLIPGEHYGAAIKLTQSATSKTITALSGQCNIIAAQSDTDPNYNDTTIIQVGCNPCDAGFCTNINLGHKQKK